MNKREWNNKSPVDRETRIYKKSFDDRFYLHQNRSGKEEQALINAKAGIFSQAFSKELDKRLAEEIINKKVSTIAKPDISRDVSAILIDENLTVSQVEFESMYLGEWRTESE